MDDEKIIDLFFERDEKAITRLQEKYESLLRTLSFNILFNNEDVSECINDTYLKTWNSIPPKRPSILRSFVCKITRNLSIDKYRNNRKKGQNLENNISIEELDYDLKSSENLEDKLSLKLLTDDINSFLEDLNVTDQTLFIRRYFLMESISDLSNRFAFTETNIKVKLLRIRNNLKKYLEKRGYIIEEN